MWYLKNGGAKEGAIVCPMAVLPAYPDVVPEPGGARRMHFPFFEFLVLSFALSDVVPDKREHTDNASFSFVVICGARWGRKLSSLFRAFFSLPFWY